MHVAVATVKDFMTKHVETIPHDSMVTEAIGRMAEKDVGSLVVTSGRDHDSAANRKHNHHKR
jgi:predicted transcriptional regulator